MKHAFKIDESTRKTLAELCREYQVKELAIFGSAARNEAGVASDLDLLVEFQPSARIGFLRYFELQDKLAELFHKKVDLVPKDGLKPLIRTQVLAEAKVLYAT